MSLKEVVADGIYARGLMRMADLLGEKPGVLASRLRSGCCRKFDVDLLERYVERTNDLTPIYYLVAKYCGDQGADRDDALGRVQALLEELPALAGKRGVKGRDKRKVR